MFELEDTVRTWAKVLIGAGLAATAAGGIAYAQGQFGQFGPGMMRGAKMERMFDRLDTDKDGVVTIQEALALPDLKFDDADTNKDGFVDRTEIDAAIRKMMVDRVIARFDVDGDGKVSKEEAEKPFKKRFAIFDRNDDGKVTKDELRLAGPGFGPGDGFGPGPGGWGHHGGGHHGWGGPGWGPGPAWGPGPGAGPGPWGAAPGGWGHGGWGHGGWGYGN